VRGINVLRVLLACGCLIAVLFVSILIIAPVVAIGSVGYASVAGEGLVYDWYNGPFADWLGVGCTSGYRLSDEDIERLAGTGIPVDAIANAEAGRQWCGSTFGANIDIGIILAIMDAESHYGANLGSTDWLQAIKSNPNINAAQEETAARWLLEYWKEHKVRERSSIAAEHIYSGYTGYYGHSSAGEIGDGFIPSTAKRVCEGALVNSGDYEVKSCNLFTRKVNGFAIPWVLYRNGYSADQSFFEKVSSLYGWNHDLGIRIRLVTKAEAINGIVGVVNVVSDVAGILIDPGKTLIGDLKLFLIRLLESINLLPEKSGWLEAPLRSEDLSTKYYENGISQEYMEKTYDKRGHPALDFVCREAGVDVIAVANGVVVEPDSNTVMGVLSITAKDRNFGNNVWIDHGGLYAIYAHMESVYVREGQKVVQGQVLGKCGSTGRSTGPHVHFQVLDIHPSEMMSYRQENPGNVNPHLYLGSCVPVRKEEDGK